jgi:beta-lactamase class D
LRLLLILLLAAGACTGPDPQPATADTAPPCEPAAASRALDAYTAGAFAWLSPAGEVACAGSAAERHVPASTFKIPHTLIAIDAGVLDGLDEVIRYDPARDPAQAWWPEPWARDHTLAGALEHSVVWFYQEVARRVGIEREREYLRALAFGNEEVGDDVQTFWLDGPLAISAEEQARFMMRLWTDDLPLAPDAQAATRELVSVLRDEPGERIRGKTGTARLPDGARNWLVGTVESERDTTFFALWVDGDAWLPTSTRLALLDSLRAELAPPAGE